MLDQFETKQSIQMLDRSKTKQSIQMLDRVGNHQYTIKFTTHF